MALSAIQVTKIADPENRMNALRVIEEVYLREKNWIGDPEKEIPEDIAGSTKYSWFLATVDREPAGVIRLVYDPSLEFPAELEVTLNKDFDAAAMVRDCKVVDIGRFMIRPDYRKNIRIVLQLMRFAIQEVVQRGYTHFITDVFESDPNSPLHFHTKILGFERIGSHLKGELNCKSARIILTLDILKAYERLKERRDRIYTEVTDGIRDLLDEKLALQKRTL